MTGICFHFEPNDVDVWSGREIDLDAWNYACKSGGGIDRMHIINKTDVEIKSPDGDLKEFKTFPNYEAWDAHRVVGSVAVLLPPWLCSGNERSLWSWDHAIDWYFFGPASETLAMNMQPGDREICIPQNGTGALHATHAASVVMMHRYHTLGGK